MSFWPLLFIQGFERAKELYYQDVLPRNGAHLESLNINQEGLAHGFHSTRNHTNKVTVVTKVTFLTQLSPVVARPLHNRAWTPTEVQKPWELSVCA